MGAKYTEAQKGATERYQKTLANISIRVKKEEYTIYKEAAARAGLSLREYIMIALSEKMERDAVGAGPDSDQ